MTALQQQFANAEDGWDFDEEAYLAGGDFTKELLQTAKKTGVRIFEDGDCLFCYPHLIRVLPADRAVLRPEAFLESLWAAYDTAARTRESKSAPAGTGRPLA